MGNAFLDAAREGKNQWWRYVLGVGIILFFAFILGSGPLLLAVMAVMFDADPATSVNPDTGMITGMDSLVTFPLLMFSFVAALIGIMVAVRLIHRRPVRSLVTPERGVNWRRVAEGALVWVALAAVVSALESVFFPGRYQLTLDLARFLPFTLMALVLIPVQTTSEELFFRGYILQGLGLLNRNPLLLGAVNGLLFALPHAANPEVAVNFWATMLFYFVFGAAMTLVTLRDNGVELALGVHASNNLFTALLANFEGSALETPAIFTATSFDPWYNLITGTAALAAFYLIVFQPWKRRLAPEGA